MTNSQKTLIIREKKADYLTDKDNHFRENIETWKQFLVVVSSRTQLKLTVGTREQGTGNREE